MELQKRLKNLLGILKKREATPEIEARIARVEQSIKNLDADPDFKEVKPKKERRTKKIMKEVEVEVEEGEDDGLETN